MSRALSVERTRVYSSFFRFFQNWQNSADKVNGCGVGQRTLPIYSPSYSDLMNALNNDCFSLLKKAAGDSRVRHKIPDISDDVIIVNEECALNQKLIRLASHVLKVSYEEMPGNSALFVGPKTVIHFDSTRLIEVNNSWSAQMNVMINNVGEINLVNFDEV